jgi:hypothetical protein
MGGSPFCWRYVLVLPASFLVGSIWVPWCALLVENIPAFHAASCSGSNSLAFSTASHHYGGFPYHIGSIPPVVYIGASRHPPIHRFSHVPAPVGPDQSFPGPLVVSLAHEKLCSSLASDVTMSLSVAD